MILIDANLLFYAYHPRAEQHEKSRAWLEAVLSGPGLVRFAWPSSGLPQMPASSAVRCQPRKPEPPYPPGSPPAIGDFAALALGALCGGLVIALRPIEPRLETAGDLANVLLIVEARFALDSPLEGNGFELPVPPPAGVRVVRRRGISRPLPRP